ncbi:hypothetical protein FBY40_3254 [Microbacterium sp. SLBN-154]|uniref:hypothetical protein n=1 Tax=Microbacterium sp. SLBN-154 TaxID=2768458 RepID=UPI001153C535|nr:hypothetical protein [Microbacterium sp. SLBN-154]TQK20714.1 hypothetical protein FBY40_3254 [Microbacterium sp. SLBN-154]
MKRLWVQIILGVLVLVAGALLLIEATEVAAVPPLVWAGLLLVGGATFWFVFFADRPSWWAAIPGAALIGAAITMVMELDPAGFGQWTEVPMLAVLGVGFAAVYLRDDQRWWAVIPAGMLLTLSVVTWLAGSASGPVVGATFLFGAAVTFALVALVPGGAQRRWWAWIPAGVLAGGAIVVLFTAAEWFTALTYVWPVAVIIAGGVLIWHAVRNHRQRVHEDESGSAQPGGAASGSR